MSVNLKNKKLTEKKQRKVSNSRSLFFFPSLWTVKMTTRWGWLPLCVCGVSSGWRSRFFYYIIVVTADLKKRERNDDGEGLWRVFVILWLAIMTRKLTTAGRWGRVWARHESISYWFFSASICRIFYERFEYISHPSRRANSTWRERELFGREFYCKYRQSRLIYLHVEERERVVKIKHCQQSA